MYYKTYLLNNMHKLHRKDPYIVNHMGAVGAELDYIKEEVDNVGKEFFFDSMTNIGIGVLEEEMDFYTTGSIEDRQSQIEARWKTGGKCSTVSLQEIADSWNNGKVLISFVNAVIKVIFNDLGVPGDIEKLKDALEEAKPAHIPIEFIFIYRTHRELENYTHAQLEQYTHLELRESEDIGG